MNTELPEWYAPRMPPYEKQLEAIRAAYDREWYGYLLDMGCGKSRCLIDDYCLLYTENKVQALIIVAPKGVYTNWTREDEDDPGELQKHLWTSLRHDTYTHTWRGGRSAGERVRFDEFCDRTMPGARIFVINVEALSSSDRSLDACLRVMTTYKTMLAVDESVVMMNPTSSRTKSLLYLRKYAAYRRILSGRPSKGSPAHVWAQFEFLKAGCLGHTSYHTFRSRYCIMEDKWLGPKKVRVEAGTQNLKELAHRMAQHSIRIRKDECLDLPSKVFLKREVPLTSEQHDVYEELRRTAMVEFKDSENVTTQIVITQLQKLQQVVCGHIKLDDGTVRKLSTNRVDVLREVLEDAADGQGIIWCANRPDQMIVTRALRETYGEHSVARWYGDVDLAVREQEETEFKAGKRRWMVASQSAGGRGRTWINATLVVYYANTYDLEQREQSEDRAHRAGQKNSVVYVDLISPGTVEDKIVKALRDKRDVVLAIMRDGPSEWI